MSDPSLACFVFGRHPAESGSEQGDGVSVTAGHVHGNDLEDVFRGLSAPR